MGAVAPWLVEYASVMLPTFLVKIVRVKHTPYKT